MPAPAGGQQRRRKPAKPRDGSAKPATARPLKPIVDTEVVTAEETDGLPPEQLIRHKVWQNRKTGFEKAMTQMGTLDADDEQFNTYWGLAHLFATETNVVVLEKALEALLVFIDNAKVGAHTAEDTCSPLVQKCLGNSKPKIRSVAGELLLMYIELERQEIVMEHLIEAFKAKNPKLIKEAVNTVTSAVNQFGVKALGSVKAAASEIGPLMEHANPEVREATKSLAIELYRWIGVALKPQLANLKPIQLTELEAEFAQVEGTPVPTRTLRGVVPSSSSASVASTNGPSAEPVAEAAGPPDPWEFMDALDIVARLPADFFEQLESKKWSERKAALDTLADLLGNSPKLDPKAQYGDIMAVLTKLITDININVSASATKCMAGFARGLRKKFATYAPMVTPVVLDKFKEKKIVVSSAVAEAIDEIAKTTTLDAMSDDIVAALAKPSPQIKIQTGLFLFRTFQRHNQQTMSKKLLKILIPPLVKTISDSDADVREAGASAVGSAMNAVGEKALMPFLVELAKDKLKMQKIEEFREKAAEESGAVAAPKPTQPTANTSPTASAQPKKQPSARKPVGSRKAPPAKPSSAPAKKEGEKRKPAKPREASVPAAVARPPKPIVDTEVVTAEETDGLSPEQLIRHKVWQNRKTGFENAKTQMGTLDADDEQFNTYWGLAHLFATETNVVVLEKALEALLVFIDNAKVGAHTAEDTCSPLVQKCLGNSKPKIRSVAGELLLMYIELERQEIVMEHLIEAFKAKNPKLIKEAVNTVTSAVNQFGVKALGSVKAAASEIGPLMEHANPEVREATKALAIELYRWIGVALKPQLTNLKPIQLTELEAEFAQVEGTPVPSRTQRGVVPSSSSASVASTNGPSAEPVAESAGPPDPWDFMDTADVVARLPADFFEQLESKKWSERKAALDTLADLLENSPKLDPKAQYGDIIAVLTKLITDSNINVSASATKCMGGFARGLRKKFATYAPMVTPVVLDKFKEKKIVVSATVAEAIDEIAKTTTLDAMSDDIVAALAKPSPQIKMQTGLFLFRTFQRQNQQTLNKKLLKVLIPPLVKTISDPDAEVRESGAAALGSAQNAVGEKALLPFLCDIVEDRLKMQKIEEFREKAMQESGAGAMELVSSMVQSMHKTNQPQDDSPPPSTVSDTKKPDSAAKSAPIRKVPPPKKAVAPVKKESEESFDGGALIDSGQKKQRFLDEKALRALRWNFTTPDEEHIEQLKNQMASVAKPALLAQLFHNDFRQFLKAIDSMSACLETCPEASIGASDVLLKWCTLRFFETNPAVLLKCLAFIKALLQLFEEKDHELGDYEINSFVPYLLLKSGEPKETVRVQVREILEQICKLTAASKVFPLIMEGTKTKNSRQRAECLEQLGNLIEIYGMPVCGQPQPALKAIGQNIADRDNAVRNAALNTILAAYQHVGDRVYKLCGNALSAKELAMLEERIRRSAKNRPPMIRKPEAEVKAVRGQTPAKRMPSRSPSRDRAEPETPARMKRPQSTGMFQLELEQMGLESDGEERMRLEPELIDHSEVLSLMSKPVVVPKTRTRRLSPKKRTSSISSVGSMDASVALDNVISQVTSSAIPTAVQAVVQLDELLKDPSKVALLTGKIDQMLMALYFQLRMIYSTHLSDDSLDPEEVTQLYRSLCAMLLALLQCEGLAREASDGPLKDLACQLLTVLLDERLEQLPDGTQIVRSINVITVKLVDKADPTACLICFMRLLRETLHSQTSSSKFQELVLKCLWKHCRKIKDNADCLNVGRILFEAHQFFVDFPAESWKQRPSDTPLRTVKTVLNNLAKTFGDKVLDYVGSIEQPHNSEAVQYLKKSVRELSKQTQLPGQPQQNGNVLSETGNTREQSPQAPSPNTNQQNANIATYNVLAEIFKKIADKENTKEGVRQLHEYKQSHPDVDIEPYLKKSTPFFQSYVHRALQQLDEEKRKANNGNLSNGAVSTAQPSAYLSRLQDLRDKLGFAPSPVAVNRPSDEDVTLPRVRGASPPPALNRTFEKEESPPKRTASVAELDALKKRLEMIKRGSQL